MRRNMLLLLLMVGTALTGNAEVSAWGEAATDYPEKSSNRPVFSETDTYLDLNTGREFRVIYDGLNETYNREDLFAFDLFVNTRTKDTFWLEDAYLVNNALNRDASGKYKVNPMKVKRDGNGYKVNNTPDRPVADAASMRPAAGPAREASVMPAAPAVPEAIPAPAVVPALPSAPAVPAEERKQDSGVSSL